MTEKTGESYPKKKRSIARRVARFLGIFFLAIILLLIVAVFTLDAYLQSNKAKIFEQLPFLNNGSISFEEAQISIYKNFPSATISLQNVLVKDSNFVHHKIPFLQAEEFRAALSLEKLWEKEVELKSIELHNGQLNFHTDSSGYKLLKALIPKPSNSKETKNNLLKDFKLHVDPLDLTLFNVEIHLSNVIKQSNIQGIAEQLKAQIHFHDGGGLSADVDMQIALKEMTFNKEKGTFLKDSKLKGKPSIHLQNGVLQFDPFEIQINEELFTFNGFFDTKKETSSKLYLENHNTRFEKISPLLTDSIRMHIAPFFIENPFYTKTLIKGKFIRDQPVTVDINFHLEENEAKVFGLDLNKINLKARFVTRFFDNRFNEEKSRKGFTLEINKLATKFQGFQIQTQNARISAPRKTVPVLETDVKVHGMAKDISNILSNDHFFFHDGNFDLFAQVDGPINDFNQLLINSDASLDLENINVYYKPADVVFPFKQLTLSKKAGDADFKLLSSTPDDKHNFRIAGLLENMHALLVDLKDERTQSRAALVANKLDWRDFIDWFGSNDNLKKVKTKKKPQSEREKKKTMKQTIRGIHNKFQPQITLNIDTLSYYNLLQIDNFLTIVYIEDENHLILEKTSFNFGDGTVIINARLDISDSLQTPFEFELRTQKLNLDKLLPPLNYFNIELLKNLEKLPQDLNLVVKLQGIIDDHVGIIPTTYSGEVSFNVENGDLLAGLITFEQDSTATKNPQINKANTKTQVLLAGDPSIFNNFFKTEQFFFSKGRFFFDFEYDDEHTTLKHILNNSNAALKIRNSSVHYKPTGVDFPLTEIDLTLKSDEADFDFLIRSDSLHREIELKGFIQNLSELVIGNTGKSIKTTVDINSPKIVWDNFIRLFVPKPKESEPVKEQNLDTLRTTIAGIFETFNPKLKAHVDTFVLSDNFTVNDFHTGIYMTDSNHLILEETAFNFHDGSISVNGEFDFNTKGPLPFKANFQTKDLDVEKLLISLNYLNLPSLEKIEKLSGRLTMNFDLSGLVSEDRKNLIPEATDGVLDIRLDDVEIRGMATLDSLAQKIRMKKRFADVRFAPIENRFTIDGHHIGIPLMEIQSNAINLFIDGTLSYTDKTNIWVAIPLDNLKKADRSIVPKKRGFAAVKSMVYVEVTTDEAGANKFKFRLSRKKFYKQRGITPQYREDKRKLRKMRKEHKKQNKD